MLLVGKIEGASGGRRDIVNFNVLFRCSFGYAKAFLMFFSVLTDVSSDRPTLRVWA